MEEKKKPNKKYRFLKITGIILGSLFVLLFAVILFIRSPWGQNIIVNKAVNFVKEKTQTQVSIEKLFITFDGDILLENLYLEDKKGDTLIYSKSLEADIPLLPIIRGKGIGVEEVDWEGLKATIIREDSISGYNFQFLIDAFVDPNAAQTPIDTTANPLNLILGDFNLKDIDVTFNDAVLGIESDFKIGDFAIEMEKTDLEKMDFRVSETKISNSKIRFYQSSVPKTEPESESSLPYLELGEISLNSVFLDYKSPDNKLSAKVTIEDLVTTIEKIDIQNNNFKIDKFKLKNSEIEIKAAKTEAIENELTTTSQDFQWPEYIVEANELDIENTNFSYLVGKAVPQKNVLNADAVVLRNLNFVSPAFILETNKLNASIKEFNFQEASGFYLKKFQAETEVTNEHIRIDDLAVILNDNKLYGNSRLQYSSLSKFIKQPETASLSIDLASFQLDLKEIFTFQPALKKNEYLNKLSQNYLTGSATASGTLSEIMIPNAEIIWGETTKINASGKVFEVTNTEKLSFDFSDYKAQTIKSDLLQFVNEIELGVSLPKQITIAGMVKGTPSNIITDSKITTSQGIATIKGSVITKEKLAFDALVSIQKYQLNQLLKNDQLGALSLEINAKGAGQTINELDADVKAEIIDFQFNNYEIKNLVVGGNFEKGKGKVTSDYKDKNLNIKLNSDIVLDSITTQAKLSLNVIGADLQALGLMKRNVKTGLKLNAQFSGNPERYTVSGTVDDGVMVYENKTYLLGGIKAKALVRKDTTFVQLNNKLLNLKLESNTDPVTFSKSIEKHVKSYFYRSAVLPDTIKNPVKVKLEGHLAQAPILNEVFLINLKDVDTVDIAVDFNENARKLKANITAPHVNYAGNEIDSLAFSMNTDQENFAFKLGFNEINSGPLAIKKTNIQGNQINNEMKLDFLSFNDTEKQIQINTKITGDRDRLVLTVLPQDLIINKKNWNTSVNNEAIYTKNKLEFNNFKFTNGEQSIEFTDKLPNSKKEHVALNFDGLKLSEFLNYLNPNTKLAKGKINGNFTLEEPFGDTGILANLKATQLNILDVNLETLVMDAKPLGGNAYDFNAKMSGGEVDLNVTGDYLADSDGAKLNLDLLIDKFNMKALEGFSQGEVGNTSGSFNGKFKINGKLAEPNYEGDLQFTNANFSITKFSTGFMLANEKLNVNNEGLTMKSFTILDENKNKLVFSGKIGTKTFVNPTFDLKVKAKDFQLLNASAKDNDFLYGKMVFDVDGTINGDLDIPVLNAKINVKDQTEVTYIMPQTTVNLEKRDGIVLFVNRENPDAILTETEEETAELKGFDIGAKIDINKNASVKIIIDKQTGDNFKVSGHGDFNFKMNPNGRMNLVGVYDVNEGHYEMNLYNLVNRKFDLAPSSRITWSGNPFDAKLDVKAIYNVEASASPLMAAQTSSADPSVKGRFRQVFPFYVYLNIKGELMQPEISFNLDMPEDEQGAVGGQVFGRIQQLNQQEAELNKQIFSLLVLNRFYPESGSDGSRGGAASIARDNLNDALSDQLNVFSDKLLSDTGVEVDFGLDSFTDYQGSTPQERTQLNVAAKKKLFDDRLVVSVGSEVDVQGDNSDGSSTPLVGNVSVEYLLTKNGRYRLKGFRRNEYENVVDGQTIVSGIALIFAQEFNKFDELWDAVLRSQSKKEAVEAKKDEDINEESTKIEE